jgi:hypothetical protein
MKNRIGFIMPRLIGVTAIAGVATLIVTIVFKLLLGLSLLAGVATLVIRLITRQGRWLPKYDDSNRPAFGSWGHFGNSNPATDSIQPVSGFATPKAATIIPID